jgi:hypothetical protein
MNHHRRIALPDSVIRALKGQRARQVQTQLTAGLSWRDQGLIFTNGTGGPLEPIFFSSDYEAVRKLPSCARRSDSTT